MNGWRASKWRARERRQWHSRLLARLALLVFLSLTFSACPCKKDPVVVAHVVVDCLAQDQGKLAELAAQLLPLITGNSPDWATFYQKAKEAGVSIGGCVAADLINKYLAPPPGNAAPSPENGQAARATMDKLRADFNGATFKTAAGEL